jgi:predicted amidohydrolase YtcJ
LQLLQPYHYKILRDKSVIASVQPCHLMSDKEMAIKRLGDRMGNAYPYRRLLDSLGMIVIGTDYPVESYSPLRNFGAAISGSGYPQSYISSQEALNSMTHWAAISLFQEAIWGSLSVGQKANFIITRSNLLEGDFDTESTFIEGVFVSGIKQ